MPKFNINIEKLRSLSVYQLRDVGACVGVQNPTTMRTKELRKAIVDIILGNAQPYKKEKSGRPHKQIIAVEDWDELIGFSKEFNAIDDSGMYVPAYAFVSSLSINLEGQILSGYITEHYNHIIFMYGEADEIRSDKFALIDYSLPNMTLLSAGDKVTCTLDFSDLNLDSAPTVKEIITINGLSVKHIPTNTSTNLSTSINTHNKIPPIIFDDGIIKSNITPGERVIIKGKKENLLTTFDRMCNNLSSKYNVIYYTTNRKPEGKLKDHKNLEQFYITFDALPSDNISAYQVAKERAKKIANDGKNVIFIVDDMCKILEEFYELCHLRNTAPSTHIMEILKNLKTGFALSSTSSTGSLTVIYGYSGQNFDDLQNQIDKIINSATQKITI